MQADTRMSRPKPVLSVAIPKPPAITPAKTEDIATPVGMAVALHECCTEPALWNQVLCNGRDDPAPPPRRIYVPSPIPSPRSPEYHPSHDRFWPKSTTGEFAGDPREPSVELPPSRADKTQPLPSPSYMPTSPSYRPTELQAHSDENTSSEQLDADMAEQLRRVERVAACLDTAIAGLEAVVQRLQS